MPKPTFASSRAIARATGLTTGLAPRLHRAAHAAVAWLAVGAACLAATQDVVKLVDGRELEGRVLHESPERVLLRVHNKEREIPSAQVAEVRSLARSLAIALERWRQAPPTSTAAMVDLAQFCRSSKLEGEARLFAWMALALDPRCAPAHELLGHELRGVIWRVPGKRGANSFDDELLAHRDFSAAWRFETLHFALRTNLPLDQACAAAVELELGHEAFTRWLGRHVELHEITEPIQVQVHADKASYPGGDAQTGYFSPELTTAFVNAEKGFTPSAMVHEATHGVIASTTLRSRKGMGHVPSWLNEAFADMAGYARSGELGHAEYDFTRKVPFYFQLHGRAADPLDLSRVVTLSARDFAASGHIALAYAQSHTLLQFGLRGSDGAHQDGLWEYVRSCYAGKSSITDFKAALRIEDDSFERAWHAYAKAGG